MERVNRTAAKGWAASARCQTVVALVLVLGLLAWQGWMTLTLFGPDQPWKALTDDRPILSGNHPLHLYHGFLGAVSLRKHGTVCCYDPGFQAGYPKTPVFDGGSRPAELLMSLAGGQYSPAAYKTGLAGCSLAVPLLLAVAAWGVGLGGSGLVLAVAAGLLVWWSTPCQRLLEDGELGFLLAGLAAVVQSGLLIRFGSRPGPLTWLGLVVVGSLGWFAEPILFAATLPLFLVYYLSVGTRHGLNWHYALLAALSAGLVVNAFWLIDYLRNWWICSPLRCSGALLPHRTFRTVWSAPSWGEDLDRLQAVVIFTLGLVGVVLWNQCRCRPAARLFGLGAVGALGMAIGGVAWEPCGRLGTARLLVPALWFSVFPAAQTLNFAGHRFTCLLGARGGIILAGAAILGAFVAVGKQGSSLPPCLERCLRAKPFELGLGSEREELLAVLVAHTESSGRILWEDLSGERGGRWTSLLPLLTRRAYIGGLDPEALIEHGYARFVDGQLAERPLSSWTDTELERFCRRYNIGWVACRSPAALARWRSWTVAKAVAELPGPYGGQLFRLPSQSFALKGQARLLQADCERIALADVVPEEGVVVLSWHYHPGLRASPSRVRVEREPDPDDPIPFVRLRVPGPVARVTLTWEYR